MLMSRRRQAQKDKVKAAKKDAKKKAKQNPSKQLNKNSKTKAAKKVTKKNKTSKNVMVANSEMERRVTGKKFHKEEKIIGSNR